MASVFISYRKDGADKAHSLHLAEDLRKALGPEEVFRDEKGLGLGRFEDQIQDAVEACRAMVVAIGPVWVERIEDLQRPKDWVRRELEAALERGILMVPVLLGDAKLPDDPVLPDSLRELLDFQIVPIQSKHWKEDVAALSSALAQHLGIEKEASAPPPPPPAPSAPAPAATPDLSGSWIDTDGVPVQMIQQGNAVQLWLLGPGGQPVGEGAGSVNGNQIQFDLQRPDYGFGSGTGTVSPDGLQINGTVQYGAQRFAFSLFRQ